MEIRVFTNTRVSTSKEERSRSKKSKQEKSSRRYKLGQKHNINRETARFHEASS